MRSVRYVRSSQAHQDASELVCLSPRGGQIPLVHGLYDRCLNRRGISIKLGQQQANEFVVVSHPMSQPVQWVSSDRLGSGRRCIRHMVVQVDSQYSREQRRRDGFTDTIGHTCRNAGLLRDEITVPGSCRESEYRYAPPGFRQLSNLDGGTIAIEYRHLAIDEDEVVACSRCKLHGVTAVDRLMHRDALSLQERSQECAVDLVVIGHQNLGRIAGGNERR